MNEHDATEIAFKNGYEKAVREIFEEIEEILFDYESTIQKEYRNAFNSRFAELKKKYTEDQSDG
jgi:hypothetical protein